jgi:hypothetical protein
MARTPLTEREKQLLEEGRRNTALREQGQPVPAPAPSVSDTDRGVSLDGPVERIGTATRVGDTLYGSATGVTPDTVEKARNYLNTQSQLNAAIENPKSSLSDLTKATRANDEAMVANAQLNSQRKMLEMAPGVSMDEDTAGNYASFARDTAASKAKARADMDSVLKKAQEFRASIAKDNLPGGKSFKEGREKWQATLKAREDEQNIRDMARMDQRAAGRARADAMAARRTARDSKNPAAIMEVNRSLYEAEKMLGPSNNTEVQNRRFEANARRRLNPYTETGSSSMGIPAAPSVSLDGSAPVSLFPSSATALALTPEEEREAKARQRLGSQLGFANI